MARINLVDLANLENESTAVGAVNVNNETLEEIMDKALFRTGESPNHMQAQLDMNNNRIINLPAAIEGSSDPVRASDLSNLVPDFAAGQLDIDAAEQAAIDAQNAAAQAINAANSVVVGTLGTQNKNAVDITGGSITGLRAPVSATDATHKAYVDSLSANNVRSSVRLATTAALSNSPTYTASTSNTLATLTATTNGTLVIDGVTTVVGDRVLVKNQATALHNDVYTVFAIGGASSTWALTKTPEDDQTFNNLRGEAFYVSEGTVNTGKLFARTDTGGLYYTDTVSVGPNSDYATNGMLANTQRLLQASINSNISALNSNSITPGTVGSASKVPVISYNSKGWITSTSQVDIPSVGGMLYATAYGAVANANSTTAIQNLLNDASANNKVAVIDGGPFLVSLLTVSSNTYIQGQSGSLKRINSDGTIGGLLYVAAKNSVIIKDLTIDGNKASQTNNCTGLITLEANTYNCEIRGCTLKNNNGAGIRLHQTIDGDQNTSTRILNNNLLDNNGSGISCDDGDNFIIEGNTFKGHGEDTIQFIHFSFPPVADVHTNISVSNNKIISGTKGGIVFSGYISGGTALAPIYGNGVPTNNKIVISDNNVNNTGSYGIVWQGSHGTIKGNVCTTNGNATYSFAGGIVCNCQNSTVTGNVVDDSYGFGIDAGGCWYSSVCANHISQTATRNPGTGIGLNIGGSIMSTFCDNTLQFNNGASLYCNGLEFAGGAYLESLGDQFIICNNTLISSGDSANDYGISIGNGADRVTLIGNRVSGYTYPNSFNLEGGRTESGMAISNVYNIDEAAPEVLTAAATTVVPDVGEHFYVTGTTGINTIRTQSENVWDGKIRIVRMTNEGTGYTTGSPPTVSFGGPGAGAAATAAVSNSGKVKGVAFSNYGTGYGTVNSNVTVTFTGGSGSSAAGVGIVGEENSRKRVITLQLFSACTLSGGNLVLKGGSFTGPGIITLKGFLGNWYEISRNT